MKKRLYIKRFVLIPLIHIVLWIGIYFFYTYFLGYGSGNTTYVNKFSLFLMPVTIAVSYFFLFVLIPKYLLEKKQALFVLYTIYTFIVSFFFISFSILYALVNLTDLKHDDSIALTKGFIHIVLVVYFVFLFVIMLGLVKHSYQSVLKNEDLKNKFLEAQLQLKEQELMFLKRQIHPHFLFNTLNTLYGFALKKSEATPEMILKLSNLLDYILYQVEKPKVLLINEIQHLEDYISLEKMRFQDHLQIYINKGIIDEHIEIPPMLLLPFVENSFKHGQQINGILKIEMRLKVTQSRLFFLIKNSSKNINKNHDGIGLKNIRKRLDMLYKKDYDLQIKSKEHTFEILLKTPLKNG